MDCNDFFTGIGFYFGEDEDGNERAEFIYGQEQYTIENPEIAKMIIQNEKFKEAWEYIAEQLLEIKLED